MTAKVQPESNVQIRQEGTKLVIEVELVDVATHPSQSGKTQIVATTSGAVRHGEVQINLNVYRK